MEEDDIELTRQIEEIRLPNPSAAEKDNGAAFGIPCEVTLNVFKLHLDKAPGKIFKFELQFFVTKKSGKEFELNNAMKRVPDFLRTKKRNALVALLRRVHESDKEFFRKQQIGDEDQHYWRSCCAFDCGSAYYTAVDLPDHKGYIAEEVWKNSEWITSYISGAVGAIRWELKKVEEFRIDGAHASTPQAMNFFSILAAQNLQRQDEVDCKKDAAYIVGGELTRDHKELRKGIVTASKTVGEDVCIQMDSKIAMFFQDKPLIDYLKMSTGIENPSRLAAFLFNQRESSKLRMELKNLPLRMMHIPSHRMFECKGFHTSSAADTTFMLGDRVISIEDYFLEQYKYRLTYPHLPLILERRAFGKGESYHPVEVLAIAEGVRVSNQKMTREEQEQMITKSCRAPAVLGRDLEKSRDVADLTIKNKYLNAFGVQIKDGFSTVPAKLLAKPYVTGLAGIRPSISDRGQIGFCRDNFKFADPVKPDKPIYFLVLDSALNKEQSEQLKNVLLSASSQFGMSIKFNGPADPRVDGSRDVLKPLLMRQAVGAAMFFFVTRQKIDDNHYTVKKLEQEIGVVTQLIALPNALNLIAKKPVPTFNVIAKMNQKLGGVVTNPEVPPDLKLKDPDAYAKAVHDWFPNRMFIGLSLSHAGAQSYADRVVGEQVKEPTCVGMAFTLSKPGKRSAFSWFIDRRKPIIEDITRHFIRALDAYAESNKGKMPTSILIFRKGMSEGELQKAAFEMQQVSAAIRQISQERPEQKDYRPTIQCVVCMANTSDRLFYQGGAENVPAGTVLDKEATNPQRQEFIIVAHNAIKGTAKPVKCTLVKEMKGRDGRALSLNELELSLDVS